ncbi:hypothetical protein GZL_08121 [Streptomyces sp. 769]|nr:hypothetical protein GZL_08121 [Streptomyces sp. 769]
MRVVVGGVGRQAAEVGMAFAGMEDRDGLHPAGEAAMPGQHYGTVVLGFARPTTGDDQFGEAGDGAVGPVDDRLGVEDVAACGNGSRRRPYPIEVPDHRAVVDGAHSPARRHEGVGEFVGHLPLPRRQPVAGVGRPGEGGEGGEVRLGRRQPGAEVSQCGAKASGGEEDGAGGIRPRPGRWRCSGRPGGRR